MNTKLMLSAAAALLLGAGQAFACGDMKKHEAASAEKKHADCPWEAPGVKTEKKAVKNGIELTLTAESPEKAAELKEKMAAHRASGCPLFKGGDEVAIENLENVVKVTVTAKKAAEIKKLQAMAKKGGSCCAGHEGHGAAAQKSASSAAWVCPMGDYEGSAKPGRCPNCGMNLVENKTK